MSQFLGTLWYISALVFVGTTIAIVLHFIGKWW